MPDKKQVTRIDYTAIVNDAAPTKPDDPGYAGSIANEAIRLDPLKDIQTSFDQSIRHAESFVRGELWQYGGTFRDHAKATITYAERRVDVLVTAAKAGEAMVAEMRKQFNIALGATNVAQNNPNEGPQLTATGEPHPLSEGGYDPAQDQAKAPNESDVAALAAGHTTPAMAEALAKADTANPDASPSSPEPPAVLPPTDAGQATGTPPGPVPPPSVPPTPKPLADAEQGQGGDTPPAKGKSRK